MIRMQPGGAAHTRGSCLFAHPADLLPYYGTVALGGVWLLLLLLHRLGHPYYPSCQHCLWEDWMA